VQRPTSLAGGPGTGAGEVEDSVLIRSAKAQRSINRHVYARISSILVTSVAFTVGHQYVSNVMASSTRAPRVRCQPALRFDWQRHYI
jgi:hypothetical protein